MAAHHPLAYRHVGDDVVDEMVGLVGHAATRADASAAFSSVHDGQNPRPRQENGSYSAVFLHAGRGRIVFFGSPV